MGAISAGVLEKKRVLIAATTWWPLSARLADALSKKDLFVAAICPAGHPLRVTAGVGRIFPYHPWRPLGALASAVAATRPDLIIPCDDRAVRHLHRLHAEPPDPRGLPDLRGLIERSLGAAPNFPVVAARQPLLSIAAQLDVLVPSGAAVASAAELARFHHTVAFPWVLKLDGSWGGRGVRVVHGLAEAVAAFRQLSRASNLAAALKHLAVNHDRFPLGEWWRRGAPKISVQAFIAGRPANALVACRNGEVLGEICVEVLGTTDPTGAATVVRVIDNAAMSRAATLLVRRLAMSGLCGFDFMLDEAGQRAWLIEMNPRATQLGHLALGGRRDLVAALCAELTGLVPAARPAIAGDTVAFFPAAGPPLPAGCHDDRPLDDPALLRELLRTPWGNRSLLSRVSRWGGATDRTTTAGKRFFWEKKQNFFIGKGAV